MSRQLDQVAEDRETKRRIALVKALEYELPGVLQTQGIKLLGFALKYDDFECLLTLKVEVEGRRLVAFVGGGSMIACILKSVEGAKHNRLRYKADKYPAPEG